MSYAKRNSLAFLLLASGAIFSLAACSQQSDQKTTVDNKMIDPETQVINFDVALHSYLDRPIFDVYLNGRDIGLAAGQPHRGAGGLMTGVPVKLGPQIISWRLGGPQGMAGNGDTVTAKNTPVLQRPNDDLTYLGVHVYPDNTVEVIASPFWPAKTEKGLQINQQWEATHAK